MRYQRQVFQNAALENLSRLDNYTDWILAKFEDYLGKDILEIGSGLGYFAKRLKSRGLNIIPTEIDKDFLRVLKKIDGRASHLNVLNPQAPEIREGSFDTVIALNVIEHLRRDVGAFKNIHKLLSSDGVLIVLVPAHNFLFGSYDRIAGHYRRYSKQELLRKLSRAGYRVEVINYCNKFSALGWFINAKLLQRGNFPKYQLYLLKPLVPIMDLIDKMIPFDFGLSIICVARKSGASKSSKVRPTHPRL